MKVRKIISPVLAAAMFAAMLSACGAKAPTETAQPASSAAQTTAAAAQTSAAPAAKPVKLSIIDVAGNLQLSQAAIEQFKEKNPNIVSDIEYIKATAPELAAKIQAQQQANNIETTMALTGYDGLSAGTELGVWEQLWPALKDRLPNLENDYLPGAKTAFDVGKGFGITYVFCPGGPMFTYNPDKVTKVPKTADDLLQWAKENPKKFLYARPANSGPGRALLQGLPYILGDTDPKDPKTWDKTWAYLKELDKYIEYYPTGTAVTFKELGEGTRYMIASHIGWDINQRILATIPMNFQGFFLDNMTWLNDAQYMTVPKGLDDARKNATFSLIQWLMTPEMQAVTYDNGYFYPGPSLKNIPLSMAPQKSQDAIKPALRPEYDAAINSRPNSPQLDSKALVEAFDMWDKLVGAKIQK